MRKAFIPLLVIPVLLLAGCAESQPAPTPSATAQGNVVNKEVGKNGTYFPEYHPISHAKAWDKYKEAGAKLPSEDSSPRTLTVEEFAKADDVNETLKVQGEVTADAEATAANITTWLEKNPKLATATINPPADVVMNRYPDFVKYTYTKMQSGKNYEVYGTSTDNSVTGYAQTTVK
jgi:hypothetical protein